MDPCPPQEDWVVYREGRLAASEREVLERHAADCPMCLEFLLHLTRALGTPETASRPAWVWRAAAAVLLLAGVTGWRLQASKLSIPLDPPAPSSGIQAPRPITGTPGSVWSSSRDGKPASLGPGAYWIDADQPFRMDTPAGPLEFLQGKSALRVGTASKTAGFLSEAWAGEVDVTLLLLDEAAARFRGQDLHGPARFRLSEAGSSKPEALTDAILAEAFEWRDRAEGAGAWQDLDTSPLGSPSPDAVTRLVRLGEEISSFVLEATLKAPEGSQVAFCYPQGPATGSATLGSGALAWQVFRIRVSPAHLEILSGSRVVMDSALSGKAERPTADYRALGLMAWQGPVEIRRLRWRRLEGVR